MSQERSYAYFGLRTNARGLLAGSPARAVEARMKVAALLHDEIWVERGEVDIHSGPQMSSVGHSPDGHFEFQTSRDRAETERGGFSFSIGPDEESMLTFGSTTSTIAWRATFDPILRATRKPYKWLLIGDVTVTGVEDAYKEWRKQGDNAERVAGIFPDQVSREVVVKNAIHDLAATADSECVVVTDRFHADLFRIFGERVVPDGRRAAEIIYPDVSAMDWSDIDEVRRHKGIRDLRALLRHVEAVARTGGSLKEAVVSRKFEDHLSAANDKVSALGRVRRGSIELAAGNGLGALGTVAMGAPGPLAASAVVTAGAGAIDVLRNRKQWVSTDRLIRAKQRAHRAT